MLCLAGGQLHSLAGFLNGSEHLGWEGAAVTGVGVAMLLFVTWRVGKLLQ